MHILYNLNSPDQAEGVEAPQCENNAYLKVPLHSAYTWKKQSCSKCETMAV